VGNAGILAFKDKFASLAQDTVVVPLGADARHVAADDVGRPSARSLLTGNTPGSSGGINLASLSRSVGGRWWWRRRRGNGGGGWVAAALAVAEEAGLVVWGQAA